MGTIVPEPFICHMANRCQDMPSGRMERKDVPHLLTHQYHLHVHRRLFEETFDFDVKPRRGTKRLSSARHS